MVNGGNGGNRDYRAALQQTLMGEGRCPRCHPHGGENDRGGRHGKWVGGTWRPSKDKTRK